MIYKNLRYSVIILSVAASFSIYGMDKTAAQMIMKASRCTTCHDIDKDKIGPAYMEVGKKYANPSKEVLAYLKGQTAEKYLFEKVRMGTKKDNRNWVKSKAGKSYGMMTKNNESKISDKDLTEIIEYILSLK